jgi:cytochrome c
MKHTLLLLVALSLFSCKQEEKKESLYTEGSNTAEGAAADLTPSQAIGKEIFDGKGMCYTCHKPDVKVIGPSVRDIAKIYKDKNGDMVAFLKEKADPIVDPSQYAVMKTNFSITKNLSDEELKGLEDYFMSHLEQK